MESNFIDLVNLLKDSKTSDIISPETTVYRK